MSWQRLVSAVRWVPGPWSPPGQRPRPARLGVAEHERTVDDGRVLGVGERDPDDVDAEERAVGVLGRRLVRAARHLLARADGAGARAVDVDVALVVGVGDHGVGVRPAAGLHRRDLPRHAHVADVEDADAAEALVAHGLGHPLQAAVEPPAGLLDRHDQQVADHRHVALPAGADHRADEGGRRGDLDAVGVEAVVAAHEDLVAGEREVAVAEVEEAAPRGAVLFLFGLLGGRLRIVAFVGAGALLGVLGLLGVVTGLGRLRCLGHRLRVRPDRHGPPRRVVRIVEPLGHRPRRHQRHVPQRLLGVLEAGREPDPRVGRQPRHHRVHAVDLGRLVGDDVRREPEEHRVLRRAGLAQQVLDHGDGAAVVLDHQLEEEPVERRALRLGEARHLVGRQHAGHRLEALGVVRVDGGDVLAALAQPVLHHLDLVFLRELDAPRRRPHGVAGGARVEQRGHLEGLGVVRDHALHEPHVGLGEPDAREVGGLGGRDGPARLAGRPRLHDGGLRRSGRRAERQERRAGREGGEKPRASEMLSGHG